MKRHLWNLCIWWKRIWFCVRKSFNKFVFISSNGDEMERNNKESAKKCWALGEVKMSCLGSMLRKKQQLWEVEWVRDWKQEEESVRVRASVKVRVLGRKRHRDMENTTEKVRLCIVGCLGERVIGWKGDRQTDTEIVNKTERVCHCAC